MTGRVLAGALVLALVGTGCGAPATTITSTGRVASASVTVQAPALAVPRVNLDAGFEITPGAAAHLSTVPGLLGLGSAQRVVAVEVRIGDQVRAGDVLVRFDDAALAANVRAAKADLSVARAQVGVLASAIDTTRDKEQDLVDKRGDVEDGIAKATKARKQLSAKLRQVQQAAKTLPKQLATVRRTLSNLKAKRPAVAEQLAQVNAQLAALPPQAPPEVRAQLEAAKKQLGAALRQIDAGIRQLSTARSKLTAAIRQVNQGVPLLKRGIRTIDANLVKARDGLTRINQGIAKIRTARADLKRARKLAAIAADNTTAVQQARTARSRAVVTAPSDGTVTSVVDAGDVIAPGATVVTIGSPAQVVQLWLPPAQVDLVCVGDLATIVSAAFGAVPGGRVSRILPLAQYPPTFHTTDEVHLTRAVPVEVTFSGALPAGVPVDVQLTPCRTNEVKK